MTFHLNFKSCLKLIHGFSSSLENLFSFDRSGFERHKRGFYQKDRDTRLDGKLALVTGASSGIGFAIAKGLAQRGARVCLLCRNLQKGTEAAAQVIQETGNPSVFTEELDVADLTSIRRFAEHFQESKVDILIHNAGILPHEREVTHDGIERVLATHLIGPFLLTELLMPKLKAAGNAQVITMSSGGMYLQKLDLKNIQSDHGKYDGVVAYANTKRAQVILNEQWAEQYQDEGVTFSAMHPGWADTPGVRTSLPFFWKWMKTRLRTPEQGADTAVWLSLPDSHGTESGKFWFDRELVPTHFFPWTEESTRDRRRLWNLCTKLSR